MSQHDYDLANQGGAAFRADANSVLAAIVSQNSGATAPATTFAYMLWADTTSGFLKQRNSANSAWIKLFRLSDMAIEDATFAIVDDGDNTKKVVFQVSSISTGQTRTITVPDTSLTLAGIDIAQTYTKAQRGAIVTLTDGATITPDFSLGNNFEVTLGGNRTLANPTNLVQGQSGMIDVVQDGTGSRTLAYGWGWSWAGATAGVLSTAAYTPDQVAYYVRKYAQSAVTISNATPGVVSWTGHGLMNGQKIQLTTTGSLPTGLTASTTYYVKVVDANSFQLSTTLGGASINTSSAGSGTHTCTAISITASLAKGVTS